MEKNNTHQSVTAIALPVYRMYNIYCHRQKLGPLFTKTHRIVNWTAGIVLMWKSTVLHISVAVLSCIWIFSVIQCCIFFPQASTDYEMEYPVGRSSNIWNFSGTKKPILTKILHLRWNNIWKDDLCFIYWSFLFHETELVKTESDRFRICLLPQTPKGMQWLSG